MRYLKRSLGLQSVYPDQRRPAIAEFKHAEFSNGGAREEGLFENAAIVSTSRAQR